MISRDWNSYLIKASFTEPEGEPWPDVEQCVIDSHNAMANPGFEARISRLTTPIVSETSSILNIFDGTFTGRRIRVYPPFPIDARAETKGAFERAWIPEGREEIEVYTTVSSTAALGLTTTQSMGPGTFFCEALRVDFEVDVDFNRFILLLLENIGQHTNQWWLRGRAQPFRGIGRLGCEVSSDFKLRELFRFKAAGQLKSPWHGVVETQKLLGFERPLTNAIWLRCCNDAAGGLRGDSGLLSFHDAVSYYMAGDDVLCIMSLSVAVEILGNKRRILKGKKPTAFSELLKTSDLIDSSNKSAIDRLFVDRGHVAHGRKPYYIGSKPSYRIEEYIEGVKLLLSRYLTFLEPNEWPTASQLGIDRKAK